MEQQLWFVESNQQSTQIAQDIFSSQPIHINFLSSAEALFEKLEQSSHPDVVILDKNLPDMDALKVCQIFQKLRLVADIPVIIVSESIALEDRHKALEAGAFDYISKPFLSNDFQQRIVEALQSRAEYLSIRKSIEDRLSAESICIPEDDLNFCLQYYYDKARLQEAPLSLFLLDIDQANVYKKTYGNEKADQLRARLCQVLKKAAPNAHIYPHGNSCALVTYPLSRKDSLRLAKTLSKRIHLLEIPHAPETSLPYISISVGTATLNHTAQYGWEMLLQSTEQALTQAKTWGANKVCQFLEL